MKNLVNQNNISNEEPLPLIISFNDIFVSIAITLVIISLYALGSSINIVYGAILVTITSWLLAELFTRKKRMALPSIVLTLFFCLGSMLCGWILTSFTIFLLNYKSDLGNLDKGSFYFFGTLHAYIFFSTTSLTLAIFSYFYWKRFRVPIIIGIGYLSLFLCILWVILDLFPIMDRFINIYLFVMGLFMLGLAIYFDLADLERINIKSDIAFWLHLISAPFLTHTTFSLLITFKSIGFIFSLILFCVLVLIALLLNRRALIVSSLTYTLYAMYNLIFNLGYTNLGLPITCLSIGMIILLLSTFWHKVRIILLSFMPNLRLFRGSDSEHNIQVKNQE